MYTCVQMFVSPLFQGKKRKLFYDCFTHILTMRTILKRNEMWVYPALNVGAKNS